VARRPVTAGAAFHDPAVPPVPTLHLQPKVWLVQSTEQVASGNVA